jgi:hypothetical protein
MKISVQLTAEDYIRARRLGMRPRPVLRYVGCGVAVLFLAFIVWQGYDAFVGSRSGSDFWMLAGLAAYFLALFYLIIPWRTRRHFNQQKTLHGVAELEFTDTHFIGSSMHGSFKMAWSDFHKWKKNDHLILVYQSAVLMHMIPLRFFQSPEDISRLVAILESNLGKEKA